MDTMLTMSMQTYKNKKKAENVGNNTRDTRLRLYTIQTRVHVTAKVAEPYAGPISYTYKYDLYEKI